MLSALKNSNLALALLMELAMLAAFACFGFIVGPNLPVKMLLGLGLPVLVAVIWAFFGAPRSKRRWQGAAYWLLRIVLFGCAAVALYFAGLPILALIFALLAVFNFTLVYIWGQE
ncbi:MAG TPA: YrdB family protein [Ktedonobacteraceae bacterium]|jgi:hypothetical protein|nr:YrdB family protein [Ktedonobacteraceae bacterium]